MDKREGKRNRRKKGRKQKRKRIKHKMREKKEKRVRRIIRRKAKLLKKTTETLRVFNSRGSCPVSPYSRGGWVRGQTF